MGRKSFYSGGQKQGQGEHVYMQDHSYASEALPQLPPKRQEASGWQKAAAAISLLPPAGLALIFFLPSFQGYFRS